MISLEKKQILTPIQKLPKNVGYLGNLIVAKGFKKQPKVQNIVQSDHTATEVSQKCVFRYTNLTKISATLM